MALLVNGLMVVVVQVSTFMVLQEVTVCVVVMALMQRTLLKQAVVVAVGMVAQVELGLCFLNTGVHEPL
jgi:hypothetical protein